MSVFEQLKALRDQCGEQQTVGLPDATIQRFLSHDNNLAEAITEAVKAQKQLKAQYGDLFAKSETDLITALQEGLVNFYSREATNPYVAIAAKGPWIITSHGAVVHDNGGYGMLGFGHDPDSIRDAMSGHQVMANVMTPNFSQLTFDKSLRQELGHNWKGGKDPFAKFICMNSGSESVTVAARISDVNAKIQTDPGGKHEGKQIYLMSLAGGFHGRTDRPAQASDSTLGGYQVLASFRDRTNLYTIVPNCKQCVIDAYEWAERNNVWFECLMMEPVMGEGNPGQAITPEWYEFVRDITAKNDTLLLVDSIQAGLRAQGCLSIVDYPGFENCTPPDMETYSKALNAGQYPLSVLACNQKAADLYRRGIYGNTMTTNPRALDVAVAVMDMVTPAVRQNIKDRGVEFVDKMKKLQQEYPDIITGVQGTGLLCAAFINPEKFKVVGSGQLEEFMRLHGVGVIHGGANGLRFTPHFRITSEEIDLIIEHMRHAFENGPALSKSTSAAPSKTGTDN